MPALPVSLQAAVGLARARTGSLAADEARVVPAASAPTSVSDLGPNAVDLLV